MLGKAADHFMLGQMRERVVAHTGNAAGTSLSIPDRERAGTAHVMMHAGQMPGPQNQLSSDYMPGVAPMPRLATPPGAIAGYGAALPGMSGGSTLPGMNGAPMLPGMSGAPMLPGMSGLGALSTTEKLGLGAAVLLGGWLLLRKKR
jgi:hypothetical protein